MAKKRKAGQRTSSGRLKNRPHRDAKLRDMGTEEAQEKRKALVGQADPTLAATAAGVLFARGYLDRDQYTEALEFGRLKSLVFGPAWPSNSDGPEASEARLASLKRRFFEKVDLLTYEQELVLSKVCWEHQIPFWFWLRIGEMKILEGPRDHAERELLISGLNALVAGRRTVMRRRKLTSPACFV